MPVRLTADAHTRLADQLDQLVTLERPRLAEQLVEARASGSSDENPDFWATRDEQVRLEDRIAALRSRLADVEIVSGEACAVAQVAAGCLVDVVFDGDDGSETYLIGTPDEARDAQADPCSPDSPMGLALRGARVGARVQFRAPSGATVTVTVRGVRQR